MAEHCPEKRKQASWQQKNNKKAERKGSNKINPEKNVKFFLKITLPSYLNRWKMT